MRIIPTHMGTSRQAVLFSLLGTDHPHAYGDKNGFKYRTGEIPGSSPRIWGQAVMYSDKSILLRIIPTHMGTSYTP